MVRALLTTMLAAIVGATIAILGVSAVQPGALGAGWLSLFVFCFIAFVIALTLVAWPLILVLQGLRLLSLPVLMLSGAAIAGFVGVAVGGTINEEEFWVLAVAGVAAGAITGALLWGLAVNPKYRIERDADRYMSESGSSRYFAFFSYARADDTIANWLWNRLDAYRAPTEITQSGPGQRRRTKLHPIFRDRVDLSAGGNVSERLKEALLQSERLVVLCTPYAAKSDWVDYEVQAFVNAGREANIFPVIASGEPNSANPDDECFPPTLRSRSILAADLRRFQKAGGQFVGDGRHEGALKLIAGLLGVDFDELVRREHHRAQRRAIALTATAAFTSSLAIVALLLAFTAINAFVWDMRNIETAVRADFAYLERSYEANGVESAGSYITARGAQGLVCMALLDGGGRIIASSPDWPSDTLPLPRTIGVTQTFSRELRIYNYTGSPFLVRSDGLVRLVTPSLALAAASCNLQPPFLYGVFRSLFTDPPQLRSRGSYHA